MRNFTGANCDTYESLAIGAGVFFMNFDLGNDTYDSAMAEGKCLGATQTGGNFAAIPTFDEIPIDGADPYRYIAKS
jgi:hypothetical protein